MSKPEVKEQILNETPIKLSGDGSNIPPLADEMIEAIDFIASRVFRFEKGFDYEPPREKSLLAEALRRDVSALEAVYDAMIEDNGKTLLYFPIFNYHEGDYDELSEMMTHEYAMTGLSDGGAHVGTICDGSFPTYLIKHWTRDRVRGETGKMEVEWAINKLTGDPAEFCGFHDRGTIELGKRADINVIDYDALDIGHPEIVADLPAGGKRFLQSATGYRATMVNGELVIEDDTLTDARPGRLARLNKLDAPAEPLKKSA
jgi:N-acyl-D-aspartate/D-glutamate deacylase